MSGNGDISCTALREAEVATYVVPRHRSSEKPPLSVPKQLVSGLEETGKPSVFARPFSPWSLPTARACTFQSPGVLLSSELLGTPSHLTPLFDILHGDQQAAALARDVNQEIERKKARAGITDTDERKPVTSKGVATRFLKHNEERGATPRAFEQEICGETRWRALALQQQHSLVVLRDLNAALLEENAWLREHVLCLQSDLAKKSEKCRRSPRQSLVAGHGDTLQSGTPVGVREKSILHSAQVRCCSRFDRQKEDGRVNCQTKVTGIPHEVPSERGPGGSEIRREATQTTGRPRRCLCTVSPCRDFHCGHLLRDFTRKNVDVPACQAANICGCGRGIAQATLPQRSHSASAGSDIATESSAGSVRLPACSQVQFHAKQEEDLLKLKQPRCGIRERKKEHMDGVEEKVLEDTLECRSNADDLKRWFEGIRVSKGSLECQGCLRLLFLAHEWARCAAVLETNRLKDLQEIASLETRVNRLRDDATTCASCGITPVDQASAHKALRLQSLPASTLPTGNEDEAKGLMFREGLYVVERLNTAGHGELDSSSMENLLQTPTPCNYVLNSSEDCQIY